MLPNDGKFVSGIAPPRSYQIATSVWKHSVCHREFSVPSYNRMNFLSHSQHVLSNRAKYECCYWVSMEQMQVKLDPPGLEILGLPHIIPLLLPRDLPKSISHSRGGDSPGCPFS